MASVEGGHLFELLPTRRAERNQLLCPLELLVVRLQHGAHRDVLHLGVGEIRADDDRQRLAAAHRGAELDRDIAYDSGDERVDLRVAVGVRRDRGRNREYCRCRSTLDLGDLDARARDRIGSERNLQRLLTFASTFCRTRR